VHLVCSYCRKDLGKKPPFNDASLTHGMCKACGEYFGAQWGGITYGEYLDRFGFPVVMVEGEGRVVAINKPACDFLGRGPGDVIGLLGGEALECAHARLPEGCGKTVHCSACAIRNSVTRTHQTGEPLSRVPARLRRSDRAFDLLVSTALEGKLVRVTIEPRVEEQRPS
jgi:PAS domain-containing protein